MEKEKINKLWDIFLNKYESDFKEYMGYGKDEIEAIGVDIFFNKIGWEDESQFESYKTDLMHIIPCINCKQDFGIVENDFGLCDKCKQEYDLEKFEKYRESISASENHNYGRYIVQLFLLSKQFRDSFLSNPGRAPMYALCAVPVTGVDDKDLDWQVCPIEDLKQMFSGPQSVTKVFKIILQNLETYVQDGRDKFFTYSEVNWDKLYNEE